MNETAPVVNIILILIVVVIIANWRTRYFDYQCERCGARINLQPLVALISIHMMGKKYVKCPNCGKWCWVRPVPKK